MKKLLINILICSMILLTIVSANGVYNSATGKCEISPEKSIICPGTYAYDVATDKCIKFPVSEIICPIGYNFNTATATCQKTAPTSLICDLGIYDSVTNKCIYKPSSTVICSSGTYDSSKGACILTPPVSQVCSQGVLTDIGNGNYACLYTPSAIANCPSNTIYDSAKDICSYVPVTKAICQDGFNYDKSTNTCDVTVQITCVQGTYDKDKKACVYEPNLNYLCAIGTLNKNSNDDLECLITPQTTIVCPNYATYNSTLNKCVGTVDYMKETSAFNYWWFIAVFPFSLVIVVIAYLMKKVRKR